MKKFYNIFDANVNLSTYMYMCVNTNVHVCKYIRYVDDNKIVFHGLLRFKGSTEIYKINDNIE